MTTAYRSRMLHEFLTSNRDELIKRCRSKAAQRRNPAANSTAMDHGVPLFLEQLVDTLGAETETGIRAVAGADPTPASSAIGRAAALHGVEMLRAGCSVDQVVHGYGDVCQAITEMAIEQKAGISTDEFHTLNRCLDDAIADAVTAFSSIRQTEINDQAEILHRSLNHFSEEQRRLLDIALQSYAAIKTGNIGMTGTTGTLLVHALEELRALADRTVPDIRLASAKTTLAPH